MIKRIALLTGSPGVGKTTALNKIVEFLRAKGYRAGGVVTREVRSRGVRVGFEVQDVASLRKGWLAHVAQKTGPQVGKYRVNVEDLDAVGVYAINWAITCADVIVIDEIGPMELFSEKFKQTVKKAVESEKPIVGVIHWKAKDKLIDEVKARKDVEIYVLDLENRDALPAIVAEKITQLLKRE